MTTHINSVSANISKDVWYHVAFTYSNNDVKLYLNNQLVGSNTTYQANIPLSSEDYYIGNDSTSYMDGTIDEMKFFNRVITSTELSYLANSNNNTSFLQNDLVGKYEFNEFDKTPTDLIDGSSLANNATPVNQPTYATGFVKGSKAIEFDSSSSQYLNISGVSYTDLDVSTFTVASWVNVNDTSGLQPIVSKDGVFDFGLSNGEIQLKMHNGTELVALPDNFVRTEKTTSTHDNLIFNMNCNSNVNDLSGFVLQVPSVLVSNHAEVNNWFEYSGENYYGFTTYGRYTATSMYSNTDYYQTLQNDDKIYSKLNGELQEGLTRFRLAGNLFDGVMEEDPNRTWYSSSDGSNATLIYEFTEGGKEISLIELIDKFPVTLHDDVTISESFIISYGTNGLSDEFTNATGVEITKNIFTSTNVEFTRHQIRIDTTPSTRLLKIECVPPVGDTTSCTLYQVKIYQPEPSSTSTLQEVTASSNITFSASNESYDTLALQSANFNGTDSFVEFANGLQDMDLNEMTISGWIKPNNLTSGTYDIMSKSNVFNFGIKNTNDMTNVLYFDLL